MSIFKQTGDGDFMLTDGKLTQSEGAEETAFKSRNRLFSVKGEWFADTSVGFPYFELVFIKNPDLDIIRTAYVEAMRRIPGVLSVESADLELTPSRDLTVDFEVRHDSGALIVGGSGTPFRVEET